MSWRSKALERMIKKVLLEMVPLVSCVLRKQIPPHQKNKPHHPQRKIPQKAQPATNTQLLFSWYVLCGGLLAQEKKK